MSDCVIARVNGRRTVKFVPCPVTEDMRREPPSFLRKTYAYAVRLIDLLACFAYLQSIYENDLDKYALEKAITNPTT